MNRGMLYAVGAYVLWGFLPIYWKALQAVPALEILAHRIVWSVVLVFILLAVRGHWRWLVTTLRDARLLLRFLASALLLSVNWFVYIWAVNAGNVVETSLGYFINPLVNVLFGVLLLHERLRRNQAVAIGIALSGVVFLTVMYGRLPWIALVLACSFGLYGLLRKTAALNSLEGLTLETLLMSIPALGYLLLIGQAGGGALGHVDPITTALLLGSGVATALPLLLFAAGARRIQLSTLGILQYLAPSLQFLLGVLVYGEPLSPARLTGFALIWLALAIYTIDGLRTSRRVAASSPAT